MKSPLSFYVLLSIPLMLVISACTKDTQEDPRFSCRINGNLWNPKDGAYSFGLTSNYDFQPDIKRDVFHILATQYDHPKYVEISLFFIDIHSNYLNPSSINLYLLNSDLKSYMLDTMLPYTIKLDNVNFSSRNAMGTFDGYLRYDLTPGKGDSLHITEGKFNVKF